MNNKKYKKQKRLPNSGAIKGHHYYDTMPNLEYRKLPSGWEGYVVVFTKNKEAI